MIRAIVYLRIDKNKKREKTTMNNDELIIEQVTDGSSLVLSVILNDFGVSMLFLVPFIAGMPMEK